VLVPGCDENSAIPAHWIIDTDKRTGEAQQRGGRRVIAFCSEEKPQPSSNVQAGNAQISATSMNGQADAREQRNETKRIASKTSAEKVAENR